MATVPRCPPRDKSINHTTWNVFRARILKHLLEAEKSTFRDELSFQRLECTAGYTVATILYALYFKDFYVLTIYKNKKLGRMIHFHFKFKLSADVFGSLDIKLSAQLSFENL